MSFKSFFIPYHRYTLTTRMTKKTILDKIDTIHTGFWDFGWLSSKRFCGFTHSEGFWIRSTYPFDVFVATAQITEENGVSVLDITLRLRKRFFVAISTVFSALLFCLTSFLLFREWQDALTVLLVLGLVCILIIIHLFGFRSFVKRTKALFEDLLVL